MRFRFKFYLLLGLILFSFASLNIVYGYEFDRTGTVTSVIDGDTFWVDYSYKVRLADVNTPEIGDPGADLATQHTSDLIQGETVYLDVDDVYETDWYGRYVCVVYVETAPYQYLNLNEDLLRYDLAEISDYTNEFNPYTWEYIIDLTPEPSYELTVYISDYSGYIGETVLVWGDSNSAKPGTEVQIFWDIVSAWDGETGLLESCTAENDGSYGTSFTVPDVIDGDHYVWVKSTYTGQTIMAGPYNLIPITTITILSQNQGTTNPAPGSYDYIQDSLITIEALPDQGYIFSHWFIEGVETSTENPLEIFAHADYTFEAYFVDDPITQIDISLVSGWNMISFPLNLVDPQVISVFQNFGYYLIYEYRNGQYVIPTVIESAKGYWVFVLENTVLSIRGTPLGPQSVSLSAGWNLIGVTFTTCEIETVLDGYYRVYSYYGQDYEYASNLYPCYAYWVLVLVETQIQLP